MKMMISSLILCAGVTAFSAETKTTTTTTTTVATPTTPTAVCQAIVESAKNKDFEGMKKWMTAMGPHHGHDGMAIEKMKGEKEAFNKMGAEHFEMIKDLTCGNELLADNHAIVMSEAQGKKRLIPFIKQNDAWKFDTHTYHSFYADEMHAKHPKM